MPSHEAKRKELNSGQRDRYWLGHTRYIPRAVAGEEPSSFGGRVLGSETEITAAARTGATVMNGSAAVPSAKSHVD